MIGQLLFELTCKIRANFKKRVFKKFSEIQFLIFGAENLISNPPWHAEYACKLTWWSVYYFNTWDMTIFAHFFTFYTLNGDLWHWEKSSYKLFYLVTTYSKALSRANRKIPKSELHATCKAAWLLKIMISENIKMDLISNIKYFFLVLPNIIYLAQFPHIKYQLPQFWAHNN